MQQPALLFGIGATRAGTTWLYRYLRAHPQCHLRGVKELHWFNTHESGRFGQRLKALEAARARLADALRRADGEARAAALRERLNDHDELIALTSKKADDAAYLAWINAGCSADTRLVGDITPAYCLVSAATLRLMQGLRPVVRFVLILRDPVARLWSNIVQSQARVATDDAGLQRRTARAMRRYLAGDNPPIEARADYRGMFTRIDQAIDPRNLLVAFHERLFSDDAIRRLTGFLGLDPVPAPIDRKVHASVPVPLDPDLAAAARARLEPQYAFMRSRFGAELPAQWDARNTEV